MTDSQEKISIAIDARPLSGPVVGYTTYLLAVIRALLEDGGFNITLITLEHLPLDKLFLVGCEQVTLEPRRAWLWEQQSVRSHLQKNHYTVYFTASNVGLPLFYFGRTKLVVCIHDVIPLIFPKLYLYSSPKYALYYLLSMAITILRARAIVTISNSSARDIKRYLLRHATVIYIPQNFHYDRQIKDSDRKNQFVYVGGVDPRKQLRALLEAFKLFSKNEQYSNFELLLIGRHYDSITPEITRLQLEKMVKITGYLTEKEKLAVIAQSQAMVYPSLYEGYGLAIGKALAVGTPVIAGKGGAQREIGGDAILYVDPRDEEQIASAMVKVLQSSERQKLAMARDLELKRLGAHDFKQELTTFFREVI